ncbi:MAG: hypothetical protein JNK75_12180 [Betaproteobacteria bacterium]|nr:hypothetical protein [Betaproteobacteria bacterium]
MIFAILSLAASAAVFAILFWYGLRQRDIDRWFMPYLRQRLQGTRHAVADGPLHVMFCFVDHFEPLAAGADDATGLARVQRWARDYRRAVAGRRDADGRPPVHTFFYPEEEYRADHVEVMAGVCREGLGEFEVHLHHDHDTDSGLRAKLASFVSVLADRHGLLTRGADGKIPFAFIHGNWALDNSRPDGRWCGVNNELVVLRESGCYADFTFPSAPSDTQPRTINSIYYAADDPGRPKSHDYGSPMRVGGSPQGDLLLMQGPLGLHWRHRKLGIWPRIENSDIAPIDIPIDERVVLWLDAHIHVAGRPEWLFIKVHTHGAIEENADWLFADGGHGELTRLHDALERQCNDGKSHLLHYVTAREMFNIAKAAEAGCSGNPNDYRDFVIPRRH